jgi:hypothetical protein
MPLPHLSTSSSILEDDTFSLFMIRHGIQASLTDVVSLSYIIRAPMHFHKFCPRRRAPSLSIRRMAYSGEKACAEHAGRFDLVE